MIHLLGVESVTWPAPRILVDLRGVGTPFTRPEQFRIGEAAAASLSHMEKIASLVPAERVTRVSEKAARRNGANVSVFDDEQAALERLSVLSLLARWVDKCELIEAADAQDATTTPTTAVRPGP